MHAKHSSCDIARHFGRYVNTVSREISRHTVNAQYCYDASFAVFRDHVTRRRARRTANCSRIASHSN
ncbi:hypothetical protein ACDI10_15690 [Vreelandella venusta]|uniref:hypothetical protein n=1 Tax=Vreelandella venusta TaxID=44935 RepID=UPI003557F26F